MEKYVFIKRKTRNKETSIASEDNTFGGVVNSVGTMVLAFGTNKKDKEGNIKRQAEFEKYCQDNSILYGSFFGAKDILAINQEQYKNHFIIK